MRIIAWSTLAAFAERHPAARPALIHWRSVVRAATWRSMDDVAASFSKARPLNADRIRFEFGAGYRLIAAVDFGRGILFVKFVGTHAEYDRIDALTVSAF